MKRKYIFAFFVLLGLFTHQAMAADSEVSFGVGIGALYSGIGVNAGLKNENDFKYIAAGCIGIGHSDNSGWILPCGIGAGWIWTGLLSKDDHRNGLGIYVGPVGINKGNTENKNKARYGLGITYVYFQNGIRANGWNFGITPAISEENGNNKGSLLLNVGYGLSPV